MLKIFNLSENSQILVNVTKKDVIVDRNITDEIIKVLFEFQKISKFC